MNHLSYNPLYLKKTKPPIFYLMSKLSEETKSLNFGQGTPNWLLPDFVMSQLEEEFKNPIADNPMYSFGTQYLLQALEKEYSRIFGRQLKWDENVIVAAGATSILGHDSYLSRPGDEVIVIEPYFPLYELRTDMFGGKNRYARLLKTEEDAFEIDMNDIVALCNEKTKYIIINSAHNPTGKIFNESHFEVIYQLTRKYPDLVVISDEVYEHLVYGGRDFPRIAAYKDMWERTISVYSAGKTYSCTGWRIGYAIGPAHLIEPMKELQRVTNNHTNGTLMNVIGRAINHAGEPYDGHMSYYAYLRDFFSKKKDVIVDALAKCSLSFNVIDPEAGYFVVVDILKSLTHMPIKYFYAPSTSDREDKLARFADWRELKDIDYVPDEAFSRFLTFEHNITPLPCSSFYNKEKDTDEVYRFIRFAICKVDEDISQLVRNLQKA